MLKRHLREFAVTAVLLAVLIALALIAPAFYAPSNLMGFLISNAPVLIIAVGMTLVILTGQVDISIGSQFAICGVLSGLVAKLGVPMPLVAPVAAIAGAMMGALNGWLTAYVRIPAIVVTLATMVALRDALRWATEGAWVQDLPESFQWFGLPQPASGAISFGIAFVITLSAAWSLRNLAAGRAVFATGSDANATRLAGIDPRRVIFSTFLLLGVLTGVAALLNSVRFNQIPSNTGLGLEMKVIAAVVVGGASVTGGKGRISGTVLGVALLSVIGPALTFLGVSAYWERALHGVIILAAVAAEGLGAISGMGGRLARQRA